MVRCPSHSLEFSQSNNIKHKRLKWCVINDIVIMILLVKNEQTDINGLHFDYNIFFKPYQHQGAKASNRLLRDPWWAVKNFEKWGITTPCPLCSWKHKKTRGILKFSRDIKKTPVARNWLTSHIYSIDPSRSILEEDWKFIKFFFWFFFVVPQKVLWRHLGAS